jgi:hypothetical protein
MKRRVFSSLLVFWESSSVIRFQHMNITLKPMLYAGAIFSCLLQAACSIDENKTVVTTNPCTGMKERSSTDHLWTTNAKVIVKKEEDTGAWKFHEMKLGDSTVIQLKQYDEVLGSFDGRSFQHIVIQLPKQLNQGQKFQLKTIPSSRASRKSVEEEYLANMRDGEITAFEFSNPLMGAMVTAEKASVEIISLTAKKALFRLILKTKDGADWEFEIDQQYTVKIE